MAYSIDLRKKVLKYRENHSLRKTSETFGVSITAILDWEKLLKTTGDIEKRPLNRTFKKTDPIKLREKITAEPGICLRESADHFGCSQTAVFYALKKEKITLKKVRFVIVKQMKKNGKLSKKLWQNQSGNIRINQCFTQMKQVQANLFSDPMSGLKEA